jgi:hypothetical protein
MRGLVLILLAGCSSSSTSWGPSSSGGGDTQFCDTGSSCPSGETCTRAEECAAPSQIRDVHVSWTIGGMPASATTCAAMPDLTIYFSGGSHDLGFAPVPCVEGKFSIDTLPTWYDFVQLGQRGEFAQSSLDDTGEATLDLDL